MKKKKINDTKLLEMIGEGKQGKDCADYFGVSPAAISKRLKRLQPPPKSLEALTPKEQRFCVELANGKTQTQAAMNSFECGSMQSAKVIGSQLVDKREIQLAVKDLLELKGYGREFRAEKLGSHMNSDDPYTSLRALDMGFKLANDYPPQRNINANMDLNPRGSRYEEFLPALLKAREKGLISDDEPDIDLSKIGLLPSGGEGETEKP